MRDELRRYVLLGEAPDWSRDHGPIAEREV
jgi:hypothetical protein